MSRFNELRKRTLAMMCALGPGLASAAAPPAAPPEAPADAQKATPAPAPAGENASPEEALEEKVQEQIPPGQEGAEPASEPEGISPEGETPEGSPPTPIDTTPVEEVIPQGEGIDKGLGFKIKGYFRGEFKYNVLNFYQGFDEQLGVWTPRGSPYLAFNMLPPESHDSYLELNVEASWSKLDNFTLYTDSSLVFSTIKPVQTTFEQLQDALIGAGMTTAEEVPSSGVPIPGAAGGQFVRKQRERVLINEAYANASISDWFTLTFGKRRIFWGSAFTWSPMDVINPPRNPLEPTLMREGSWNATLELVHFDTVAASLLYKPYVLHNDRGLPGTWDFSQGLAVGRVYINAFDTDLNLVFFNNYGGPYTGDGSNSFGRQFGGLSFSRYVFDVVEIHAEALLQRGRPTWLVEDVTYAADDPTAPLKPPYELGQLELGNGKFYSDFLIGSRYNFEDNSFLLVEYLHHGAGMSRDEYRRYRGFTAYMQERVPSLVSDVTGGSGSLPEEQQAEVEQAWTSLLGAAPYLYQEANVRRNYLGVTFMKSRMWDFLEPKLSVIWNMDDLSGTLYPSAEFTLARNSGGRGTVKMLAGLFIFLGSEDSQVGIVPNRFTANLRMTAYF